MFGAVSVELWRLASGVTQLQKPMALASSVLALYYLCRMLALLTIGPDSEVFALVYGSGTTALLTMVVLVIASFSMTALNTEQVTRDLQARASHDALTGLLNRSGFTDLARDELGRVARDGLACALVMADIDRFKTVNDTHGHAAGDIVLSAFAGACKSAVRSTDLVGRFGGEEFVLLLPGAQAEHAQAIAQQISAALAALPSQDGQTWPTVSYGIASIGPGTDTLGTALAAADAALYEAKAQGRNCSVLARQSIRHQRPVRPAEA